MGLTSWEAVGASAVAMASALSCCQEFLVGAGLFLHRCLFGSAGLQPSAALLACLMLGVHLQCMCCGPPSKSTASVGDCHDIGIGTQHANAIEKGMCSTYMPADMLAAPRRLGMTVTAWEISMLCSVCCRGCRMRGLLTEVLDLDSGHHFSQSSACPISSRVQDPAASTMRIRLRCGQPGSSSTGTHDSTTISPISYSSR